MRALITGASPGIGGATCRRLVDIANIKGEKIKLAACEITETDAVKTLAKDLRDLGAEVLILTGDLSKKDIPKILIDRALDSFGGLDAVISNAGITSPAPLNELDIDQWDKLIAVNTRATLLLAQAAYTSLKNSKGSFVAVASMSGMGAHPGMGPYNVNTVSPGMIRTPLTHKVYENNQIAKDRAALIPLGRIGEPEDIANAIGFLISPEAEYMTGQNLLIDGGFVDSLYGHIPGLPRSTI